MPRASTRSQRSGNRFRQRPERTHRVTRTTPIESDDGGTQITTTTTTPKGRNVRTERRTGIPTGGTQTEVSNENTPARTMPKVGQLSPTTAGERVAGVGLLEAEFLIAIFLQILLLFADTNKSYADKIMQTMKRGTLISLLFFILALMAGIGGNSARIAKAIGALVIAAIFLTSPFTTILGNTDTFFKSDWSGTNEHGNDVGATGASSGGTDQSGTTGQGLHAAEGAVNRITQIIESFGFGLIK